MFRIIIIALVSLISINSFADENRVSDFPDFEKGNIINIKKMIDLKKELNSVDTIAKEAKYKESAATTNIVDLMRVDAGLGPTTICSSGHRWICIQYKLDGATRMFDIELSGFCKAPSIEAACFQAY